MRPFALFFGCAYERQCGANHHDHQPHQLEHEHGLVDDDDESESEHEHEHEHEPSRRPWSRGHEKKLRAA